MQHGESWVLVLGRRDCIPDNSIVVDVTSRSKEKWTKELSPFFLGPLDLYNGISAKNMENAWQYCKVYKEHTDELGNPSDLYWKWAKEGFSNSKAVRFPFGRGAKPEYSLWNDKKLGYIEARNTIYAPLYAKAVQKTNAWKRLVQYYEKAKKEKRFLVLLDFDGHDSQTVLGSYKSILYNYPHCLGHGFVLAMLLDKQEVWNDEFDETLIHFTKIPLRRPINAVYSETKVLIRNIPENTTIEELGNVFSNYEIINIEIKENRRGESKGYGFLEANSHNMQQELLKENFILHDRLLTLCPAYHYPNQ